MKSWINLVSCLFNSELQRAGKVWDKRNREDRPCAGSYLVEIPAG